MNAHTPLTERERERLKLMRLERGWSYREMARRAGITEPTLRAILERLHERPRQTTTFRLRRWLTTETAEAR